MSSAEMPIFNRTFDLLVWLLSVTNHFPRAQRHIVTQRLLNTAFDLREQLEEANIRRGAERLHKLGEADASLAKVKLYLRLAKQMGWLSMGQYEHSAQMVVEIGRLLGGWQKTVLPAKAQK